MINFRYIGVIFITFLLAGCEQMQDDCLKSTGKIVEKTIVLDNFQWIEVYDIFDIYLTSDTFQSVSVSGGENLLPSLEFFIKDDTLRIENNNKCRWLRKYGKIELHITKDQISRISLREPSNLYSVNTLGFQHFAVYATSDISEVILDLNCSYFEFVTAYTSTGSHTFTGKSDHFHSRAHGSVHVNASTLETRRAEIFFSSIGAFYVNVSQELIVRLMNVGNIYYFGNPEHIEIQERQSSGDLIQMEY